MTWVSLSSISLIHPLSLPRKERWFPALLKSWLHSESCSIKWDPQNIASRGWKDPGGLVNRARAPTGLLGSCSASVPQRVSVTRAFERCVWVVFVAILPWLLYPHIKANCLIRKKGTWTTSGPLCLMHVFLGMEEKDEKTKRPKNVVCLLQGHRPWKMRWLHKEKATEKQVLNSVEWFNVGAPSLDPSSEGVFRARNA